MTPRRVLLLGGDDFADETACALAAADADVVRLADPGHDELREALSEPVDVVAVISRDDAWPLRVALLVRHVGADVPIIATIFDPVTGGQLEKEIGNCTITSLADIVSGTLAGPSLGDFAAVVEQDGEAVGLRCSGERVDGAGLPGIGRATCG